jgi:hypothetical protein
MPLMLAYRKRTGHLETLQRAATTMRGLFFIKHPFWDDIDLKRSTAHDALPCRMTRIRLFIAALIALACCTLKLQDKAQTPAELVSFAEG